MANCNSCSAPLPANINRCSYCNVRNDMDLQSKHAFVTTTQQSDRICPACDIELQTIELDSNQSLEIERCETCFGLFFDPGEIQTFLQSSVSNVFDINLDLIKTINQDRYQKNKKFSYVKCPVCQVLMNRVNFAHKSGVIVDQCRKHGIWLNSGEMTHLMEWKKAGGELLHEKNEEDKKAKKQNDKPISSYVTQDYNGQITFKEDDLFNSLSSFVFRLFG